MNDLTEEQRAEYDKIMEEWRQKVAEIPESTDFNKLSSNAPYKELEDIYLPKLRAIANM